MRKAQPVPGSKIEKKQRRRKGGKRGSLLHEVQKQLPLGTTLVGEEEGENMNHRESHAKTS